MRKLLILSSFVAVLLVLASCSSTKNKKENHQVSQEKEHLRVLCYNMHYANPPSKPGFIDLDAIAKVINDANPDLVALQEVDVNVNRSGKINEIEILAQKTGMKAHYFAKSIDHDGGDYGIAILSKFEILESNHYPLPHNIETKPEPRVLATIRVETPNGFEFIFANTHLEVRHEENRLMQLEEIDKILKKTNLPVIIAGDFNAQPGSKTIQYLDRMMVRTCEDCQPTIPVINPKRAIDFIAFGPKMAFDIIDHQVINETYASDHLPIFAILEIQ